MKNKEIRFYNSIIEDFYSSLRGNKEILLKNICFLSIFNYRIYYGCTKITLVPKNKGARYVIKVPIEDCETDFCAKEVQNYEEAKRAGLDKFFSETFFFSSFKGTKFYLQEKENFNSYYNEDDDLLGKGTYWEKLSWESRESAADNEIGERVLEELLKVYNYSEVEDFIRFCAENEINDIHNGNFGVDRKTGAPKVFDFSGI